MWPCEANNLQAEGLSFAFVNAAQYVVITMFLEPTEHSSDLLRCLKRKPCLLVYQPFPLFDVVFKHAESEFSDLSQVSEEGNSVAPV